MEKFGKKIECFEDLFTRQRAVEFAKEIYLVTERKGLKNDFGLKNQLYVACKIGYLEKPELENLREKAKFLSGSIANHVNSINAAII